MIKRISLGLLIVALSTSCVSKKIYNDLESKYADLKKENRSISDENAELLKSKTQLELDKENLNKELDKVKTEREKYNYYMNNLPEVDALLKQGATKAGAVADIVLKKVRVKLGFE